MKLFDKSLKKRTDIKKDMSEAIHNTLNIWR